MMNGKNSLPRGSLRSLIYLNSLWIRINPDFRNMYSRILSVAQQVVESVGHVPSQKEDIWCVRTDALKPQAF